jgi:hypothetical protein
MSVTIEFGDEIEGQPTAQIATNKGWEDVRSWANGLGNKANKDYPELMRLIDHGESHDLGILVKNIDAALAKNKPKDSTVASTLSGLRDVVKKNQREEYVVVSDGFFSGYEHPSTSSDGE